jgi:hypothetical protein
MLRFVRRASIALPISFFISACIACVLVIACGGKLPPGADADAGADTEAGAPSPAPSSQPSWPPHGPLCEGCDPDPSYGCPCPGLGAACEINECARGLTCTAQNLCAPKGTGSACSIYAPVDDCVRPTHCQCSDVDGGSGCSCQ